jgi:hypothetical protein
MSNRARKVWWPTSLLLIGLGLVGAFFPHPPVVVLVAHFGLGMGIAFLCMVGRPGGPDAVMVGGIK